MEGFLVDVVERTRGFGVAAVLCPQVAAVQAKQAGHSTQEELELLCVHGILHLLGYDHAEPEEHAVMFGTQDQLLKAWRETQLETQLETQRETRETKTEEREGTA